MSLRLRFGPYAGQAAAQVVLNDPQYCLWWLAERPDSALAAIFRELVCRYDDLPFTCRCTLCPRRADQVHALTGSIALTPYCRTCAMTSDALAPAHVIRLYEDAVRHVAQTCPRAHRILMRRVIKCLAHQKGAPQRFHEAPTQHWLTGSVPLPQARAAARPARLHRAA